AGARPMKARKSIRRAALSVGLCAGLIVVGSISPSPTLEVPSGPDAAAVPAPDSHAPVRAGRDWLTETRAALDSAPEVRVPFAEQRDLADDSVAAFAFDALGGQVLEVTLTR